LILRKIIKFVATRCHIVKLKCTKFNFVLGLCPRPHWGAYSAAPDPLAGFKGPTSKGREGKGWRMGEEREERGGKGMRREGSEEKGRSTYRNEGPLTKILNTPLGLSARAPKS